MTKLIFIQIMLNTMWSHNKLFCDTTMFDSGQLGKGAGRHSHWYVLGIVSLHTPFLYCAWQQSEFSSTWPLHDHTISLTGSPCTMHSNLAVLPLTTAMSFNGCNDTRQLRYYNMSYDHKQGCGFNAIKILRECT